MLPGFPVPLLNRQLTLEASQSLPAMTAGNLPSGHEASASSFFNASGVSYLPYQAFDQQSDTQKQWVTAQFAQNNCWLQRKMPSPIMVGRYTIKFNNTAARAPGTFSLLGSNDGSSFITLDSRTGQTGWPENVTEARSFDVASPDYFLIYRLFVTSNNGDVNYTTIYELEFLQAF